MSRLYQKTVLLLTDRAINRYGAGQKFLTVREKSTEKKNDLRRDAERSQASIDRWRDKLNEVKIYHIVRSNHFTRFKREHQLDAMPVDDVLQEIRLAMLETAQCSYDAKESKLCCAYNRATLLRAVKNLRRLVRKFDYSEKAGAIMCSYTKCDLEQMHSSSAIEHTNDFPLANKILDYYETHTVKETCAAFGIEFNQKIARAFAKYFCKHEGNRKSTKTPEQIRQQNLLAQKRWRERKLNSHVIAKQNAEQV